MIKYKRVDEYDEYAKNEEYCEYCKKHGCICLDGEVEKND